MVSAFAYCLLLAASSLPVLAGDLQAVRVAQGPRVDGRLDDAAWQEAAPFAAFRMADPVPGGEPSAATELRIVYDDSSLYIGVLCLDSEPARIAAHSMAHDGSGGNSHGYGEGGGNNSDSDDVVRVLLDPFRDRRTAYFFSVNPRGARSEGLAAGGAASLNWDGIWDAAARIDGRGWSAELRIPFKTLQFDPALTSWGINVERFIARRQETVRLAGVARDCNFYNPMDAAALSGIIGVRQGRGITVRPYGLARLLNAHDGGGAGWELDGGVDVYKNFTPNLVGALSVNMDFAETEADERRINLTRFPLFFPEKRMFFLEGSETFGFSSSVSFQPFFSRKIGLYQGEPVPILFGGKVFGKVGRTNLAFLDVQTGRFAGMPGRNLLALRLTRDVLSESKVGLILTNGSPTGGRNTLAGVDFRYATSRFAGDKNLNLAAWAAYNWNERREGSHAGFGFRANYPNDLWDVQSTYAYYGEALDPGLGFMMRQGIQTAYLRVGFQPRPASGPLQRLVRQFFFSASGDFYWDLDGNLETRRLEFSPLSLRSPSGARFDFEIQANRDVLPSDFEVAAGVVLPAGAYDFTGFGCSLETAPHRALVLDAGIDFGQFYSGRYEDWSAGITFKYKGYANIGLDVNLVRGRLPQGDFNENVFQLKADLFLSPDLGFMNYVQYDTVSRLLGWSARLKWRLSPGNEAALIYNRSWERRWAPQARFFPSEERGVLKLSLSFRP
jgi:hypothetical protein